MTYPAKLNRQAKRLGVTLPSGDVDCSEEQWSSDGHDDLFVGPCLLTFGQGGWTVKLRRSGRKAGYRKVQAGLGLKEAVELAEFLAKPANRRAYRGLAPKERKVVTKVNEHLTVDQAAALKELLTGVNGGAVTVTTK